MHNIPKKMASVALVLVMAVCLCLSGCTGQGQQEETTAISEDTFRIVTSFYPMYILVSNLTDGAEGVEVTNMASPQTGCLHDYQLRPKDLVCLDGADLFVINGGGMENFLDDVMEAHEDLFVVRAMDAISEEELLPGGEEDEGGNPHTWMNMDLYAQEVAYISEILAKKDPGNQDIYAENAKNYTKKIQDIQEEYARWKEEAGSQTGCILLHESFAYLMDMMDVPVAEILDVEKDSGFSARELRELIDEAKEISDGIIVSDQQYSGQIAELLSEETGFPVVYLDSCVSGELDPDAYINSMENNLEEWKKCSQ